MKDEREAFYFRWSSVKLREWNFSNYIFPSSRCLGGESTSYFFFVWRSSSLLIMKNDVLKRNGKKCFSFNGIWHVWTSFSCTAWLLRWSFYKIFDAFWRLNVFVFTRFLHHIGDKFADFVCLLDSTFPLLVIELSLKATFQHHGRVTWATDSSWVCEQLKHHSRIYSHCR